MATTIHGLYAHSHWQGAGPDRLLAVGSRSAIAHAEEQLSTCSVCRPGRAGSHRVGTCYDARPVGYRRRGARELPDDAVGWDRADLAAWLDDIQEDVA